ncbi:dGTPase [Microbacterium azadirachtae]|uniref:dGTPase n=1 Tax=Microbacterium azadirachtae TaxID=582680 RepID=A0A1I6HRH1_9MICO|nr:dGTPase [Microbacterium azadirachtae]
MHRLADGSWIDPARAAERYGRRMDSPPGGDDFRTPTERDRGRLGYSAYLRRLAGVTQVVSPELASAQMHSRSSHTHKVAMIAREIADHVARGAEKNPAWLRVIAQAGGLDISACEAAGLAHDIGHPPFGHAGEDALNDYLERKGVEDGFEGNAQTFRTVARLDRVTGTSDYGLNLTNVTLAAILKYPYPKKQPYSLPGNRKFGAYSDDEGELYHVRSAVLGLSEGGTDHGRQTLEASIMDLADDIAYAIHDLEDFLAAGLIDVGLVLRELVLSLEDAGITEEDRAALDFAAADFNEPPEKFTVESKKLIFVASANKHRASYFPLFNDVDYAAALHDVSQFLEGLGDPDREDYPMQLRLSLKDFVGKFFANIKVSDVPPYEEGPSVYLSSELWHQMQVLKSITRYYLVSRPRMGSMQRAQSRAIEVLMDGLAAWICAVPETHALPPTLLTIFGRNNVPFPTTRQDPKELSPAQYRALADYVCTMSDSEALMRSQWLAGTEVPGSFRLALS